MEPAPILAHTVVTHEAARPSRAMIVLHGVFGMGLNFRTFSKTLAHEVPDWAFVLVDLRGHAGSRGFAPPHTLDAAAADVAALIGALDLDVQGIVGHSLGGKVALAFLAAHPGELARAFILDAMPGPVVESAAPSPDDPSRVLRFLESLPSELASRDVFRELARDAGLPRPIAEWLAMNLRRDDGDPSGPLRLRLDLGAIRSLLVDYRDRDLWSVVRDGSVRERLELVVAGRSRHYAEEDRERARAIARTSSHVSVSVLPNAGHWLHVDDAEGLRATMSKSLIDD